MDGIRKELKDLDILIKKFSEAQSLPKFIRLNNLKSLRNRLSLIISTNGYRDI